ncbi:MAG: hypothetical protein Kow0068_04990 [Marinilabiliales bacterium]
MLNIALFGMPGAGKGTQSEILIKKHNLAYISTGDILRQEISEKSKLGLEAQDIISKGGLVSDEIIVQILEKRIKKSNDVNGFLFDGFPRTYVQAYILEGLLLRMNTELTCMLSLEITEEEATKRLLKRGETSGRSDDNLEVIKYRLQEYKEKTLPLKNFYKEKKIFIPINGIGTIKQVHKRVEKAIERTLKKVLLNVVIFGFPGAGKGTQAKMLAQKFNLIYISTGDMIRDEIEKNTEFGKKAKEFYEQGLIVPDEIVIRLIENKINKHPKARGFLFNGFPRTIVQAYILEGILLKLKSSVSCMIEIKVPMLELLKRLSHRAKTTEKRIYDGNIDAIVKRLEEYEKITVPVADYYRKLNKVFTVDGTGTKEEIFDKLSDYIDKAFKQAR